MLTQFTQPEKSGPWSIVAPGIRRRWTRTDRLMMVIVEFTNGPASHPDPFHHHPHEQASYVAKGDLILFVEGHGQQELKQGDMFAIPSGVPHAIQTLSRKVRIIDCFTPIREDFINP